MQRLKFIYHELELTRRCNAKCSHCMRGKAQAKDISLEHLDLFFQKTEMIESLTLTGGEVSLVPKLMKETLRLIKKYNTKIGVCGIITNGLYVSDAFIEMSKEWVAHGEFHIEVSRDAFHKPIPKKNMEKLKMIGCDISDRHNKHIQRSGRAKNLSLPQDTYYSEDGHACILKPYWLLNGWIMQCTYLNALGQFVIVDGSYKEQKNLVIGDVHSMDYDTFTNPHPVAFLALQNPYGIGPNNSRWQPETIVRIAKQGSPGPTLIQWCPYTDETVAQVIGLNNLQKAS